MFAILVLCSLVFCLEICRDYGVLNRLQDLRPGLSLSDDDFFPGSAWVLICGSKLFEQSCVVRFELFGAICFYSHILRAVSIPASLGSWLERL